MPYPPYGLLGRPMMGKPSPRRPAPPQFGGLLGMRRPPNVQQGLLGQNQMGGMMPRPMPPRPMPVRRPGGAAGANQGYGAGDGAVATGVGTHGLGSQAQNAAVVNTALGAMLSTMATPLAPMAINAITGANLGRSPLSPFTVFQMMQAGMSNPGPVGPGIGFGNAANGPGLGFGSTGISQGFDGGGGVSTGLGNTGLGSGQGMTVGETMGAAGGSGISAGGLGGLGANIGNSIGNGLGGISNSGGYDGGGFDSASIGMGPGTAGEAAGAAAGAAAAAAAAEGGDGGSGAGGTVICTELHRQGRLEQRLYELDEAFGAALALDDPLALVGYQRWARPVVRVMQRSPRFSAVVAVLARPWALEMAREMGHGEGSRIGRLMMRIGLPLCRALGRSDVQPEYQG